MTALLLLDFQQDFFELGTTPAHQANTSLILLSNQLLAAFPISAAVNDAHPANHSSFAANHLWRRPWQTLTIEGKNTLLWPMHAVVDSFGAEAPAGLHTQIISATFSKGTDPLQPGFSAFESPDFVAWLGHRSINHLVIIGTLLEYSVQYTAFDALHRGLTTTIIPECCGFLELQPGDREKSIQLMRDKGVQTASLSDYLSKE